MRVCVRAYVHARVQLRLSLFKVAFAHGTRRSIVGNLRCHGNPTVAAAAAAALSLLRQCYYYCITTADVQCAKLSVLEGDVCKTTLICCLFYQLKFILKPFNNYFGPQFVFYIKSSYENANFTKIQSELFFTINIAVAYIIL